MQAILWWPRAAILLCFVLFFCYFHFLTQNKIIIIIIIINYDNNNNRNSDKTQNLKQNLKNNLTTNSWKCRNKNAGSLKELRSERNEIKQDNIQITTERVTQQTRKVPNWKCSRPDGVQGHWLKNFPVLHESFQHYCLSFMTEFRRVLIIWSTRTSFIVLQP